MKSHSFSFASFIFVLASFGSANPLMKRVAFDGGTAGGNSFGESVDDLPDTECNILLGSYWGDIRRRDRCTKGLSTDGGPFGMFSWDRRQQENDPNYADGDRMQCCLQITCTLSNNAKGYCTNKDNACRDSTESDAHCPGYKSKCCINNYQEDLMNSVLPSIDLFTTWDQAPTDPNFLFASYEPEPEFADDATLYADGTSLSLFDPDQLQVSYGLTTDASVPEVGDEIMYWNSGGELGDDDLFANLGEETVESPLDIWSR